MPYQYPPKGPGSPEFMEKVPYGAIPYYEPSAWRHIVSVLTTAYNQVKQNDRAAATATLLTLDPICFSNAKSIQELRSVFDDIYWDDFVMRFAQIHYPDTYTIHGSRINKQYLLSIDNKLAKLESIFSKSSSRCR